MKLLESLMRMLRNDQHEIERVDIYKVRFETMDEKEDVVYSINY